MEVFGRTRQVANRTDPAATAGKQHERTHGGNYRCFHAESLLETVCDSDSLGNRKRATTRHELSEISEGRLLADAASEENEHLYELGGESTWLGYNDGR